MPDLLTCGTVGGRTHYRQLTKMLVNAVTQHLVWAGMTAEAPSEESASELAARREQAVAVFGSLLSHASADVQHQVPAPCAALG